MQNLSDTTMVGTRPRALRVPRDLYHLWCSHRGGALAAELLLFGVLSALPLLLSLVALLGSIRSLIGVTAAQTLEAWTNTQVQKVLGAGTPVSEIVHDLFKAPSGRAVTLGLIVALYGASRGFTSLVGSLDVVYGSHTSRGWVNQRVTGLFLTVASSVVLTGAVLLGYASRDVAASVTSHPFLQTALNQLVNLLGYAMAAGWVATLYHIAPKSRTRWRDHVPGAVLCMLLVGILTLVFRYWLVLFSTNAVFGVLSAAISLLWWGYFSCSAFFLGAELNRYRMSRRSGELRS